MAGEPIDINMNDYLHISVIGDGDCFYHCIRLYRRLFNILPDDLSNQQLREKLYNYIVKNNLLDYFNNRNMYNEIYAVANNEFRRHRDPRTKPALDALPNKTHPLNIIKAPRIWRDAINSAALQIAYNPDHSEIFGPIAIISREINGYTRMGSEITINTMILFHVGNEHGKKAEPAEARNHYEVLIPKNMIDTHYDIQARLEHILGSENEKGIYKLMPSEPKKKSNVNNDLANALKASLNTMTNNQTRRNAAEKKARNNQTRRNAENKARREQEARNKQDRNNANLARKMQKEINAAQAGNVSVKRKGPRLGKLSKVNANKLAEASAINEKARINASLAAHMGELNMSANELRLQQAALGQFKIFKDYKK
jgi:hypothetical protein